MIDALVQRLRQSRMVSQLTQVQPTMSSVEKTEYKEGMVARPIGYMDGVSLHATRDILSAPVWGSTQPNVFITVHGQPPVSPVIGQVGGIFGSNTPPGGGDKPC